MAFRSVVWQQKIKKVYIRTYKIVLYDRPGRYYEMDYTKDFETPFRASQVIEDYNPHYFDTEYGKDPYWEDSLYNQMNLQFRRDDYPPTDDEHDPVIADNKLTTALIEIWRPNPEPTTLKETQGKQYKEQSQESNSFIDEKAFLHVVVARQGEPSYVPLSIRNCSAIE